MLAREENKDYFAAYVLVGLGGLWMMSAYSKAGMGICASLSSYMGYCCILSQRSIFCYHHIF